MTRSLVLVGVWCFAVSLYSSRLYFLNPYSIHAVLPPQLEPFGIVPQAVPVCALLALLWLKGIFQASEPTRANIYLLLACAPLVSWILGVAGLVAFEPLFVEVLWLAAWTGLSFRAALRQTKVENRLNHLSETFTAHLPKFFMFALLVCAAWWYAQTCWYYDSFLLGYNDFGHFIQRLSNTVNGQGLLVETPVLPRFWDHFNPGLLLLLPCWLAWPDVHQPFLWQSLALAGSSYLIYRIAIALQHEKSTAALFGLAWLVHPAIGQMNLAYSYGWHPITMAIPALLASIWALTVGRLWWALVACTLALSMEEGVFVIVSLTAFCCGGRQWWLQRSGDKDTASNPRELPADFSTSLSAMMWLTVGFVCAGLFVVIYKSSGLAEFQAGRFVTLGTNATEILLSPVRRPQAFWGAWLAVDRWIYFCLLAIPCGLPALARGWFYLLPTLLPLAVLTVWDHPPAHCICFQYASTLLPLIALAAITGARVARDRRSAMAEAAAACVAGILLSMFIGQLPFSTWTLLDVDVGTYGAQPATRRRANEPDAVWLEEQLKLMRTQPANCLATGRIAAHLVGMPDLETVGQYTERRERLSRLPDREEPIRHYEWLILDRREFFQQTATQIQAVEAEAKAAGYREVESRYDIVILRRS